MGNDFRERSSLVDNLKNITPKDDVNTPVQHEQGVVDIQNVRPFPQSEGKFKLSFPKIGRKKLSALGGIFAVLLVLIAVFGVIPAVSAYSLAKRAASSGQTFYAALQEQDLAKTRDSMAALKHDVKNLDKNIGRLSWASWIPFFGGYVADAKHTTVGALAGVEAAEIIFTTIEPYSDILGFNGHQAEDGAKTAEDRINFIVESIDQVIPQLDTISAKTSVMASEFNQIDPNRYPEHFRGREARSLIRQGIRFVNQFNDFITNGKPVLEQAPYLLGIDEERTYLVLFQNDKEIRPTGGFITGYSIVNVKDGKFQPASSNDIYNLDNQLKSRIPAPDPIKKYLPLVDYWFLRDMNLSPDFKVSMDTFFENYSKIRSSSEVDGIIAVDTFVPVFLLEVIGRIGVPGFGNFSSEPDSRCNCPVVIYELESYADVAGPIVWDDISGKIVYKPPHADNRKAIVGPLMNSLISNAMGQPKEKIPGLFEAAWRSLTEKHVLFYFKDEKVQSAMESFNLAGRIKEFDGDYLHINDTNFAGAKSNLYVQQETYLKVEPGKDGTVNTLTIKYKNPQKYDGWLNAPYRDWVRVYVPEGSTLIDSTGSETEVETSADLGKTVFEGFFILRPEGVTELTFQYKTPVKGVYRILVQKQPGTEGHLYAVEVGGQKEEFNLAMDKELHF